MESEKLDINTMPKISIDHKACRKTTSNDVGCCYLNNYLYQRFADIFSQKVVQINEFIAVMVWYDQLSEKILQYIIKDIDHKLEYMLCMSTPNLRPRNGIS